MKLVRLFLFWVSFFSLSAQNPIYELLSEKTGFIGGIEEIISIPEAKFLMLTDGSGKIYRINPITLETEKVVNAHNKTVNRIWISHNPNEFISAGDDGKIKVWSIPDIELKSEFTAQFNRIAFATLLKNKYAILYGGYAYGINNQQNGVYIFNPDSNVLPELHQKITETNPYLGFTFGITDGTRINNNLVIFGDGYALFLLNESKQSIIDTIPLKGIVNSIQIQNNRIHVWAQGEVEYFSFNPNNPTNIQPIGTLKLFYHTPFVSGYARMASHPDNEFFATGNPNGDVFILNTLKPEIIAQWKGHIGGARAFCFIQNGSVLLSGGKDGTLKAWGTPITPPNSINVNPIHSNPQDESFNHPNSKQISPINQIPKTLHSRIVTTQQTLELEKGNYQLTIKDTQKIDGDSISIWLNGEWILENHLLTSEPISFNFTLSNGIYPLILHAHNLGEIPPNTAGITIANPLKTFSLNLRSNLKHSALLILKVN
jgi:WD40 repeat protein